MLHPSSCQITSRPIPVPGHASTVKICCEVSLASSRLLRSPWCHRIRPPYPPRCWIYPLQTWSLPDPPSLSSSWPELPASSPPVLPASSSAVADLKSLGASHGDSARPVATASPHASQSAIGVSFLPRSLHHRIPVHHTTLAPHQCLHVVGQR
jgi:hypothetical protein